MRNAVRHEQQWSFRESQSVLNKKQAGRKMYLYWSKLLIALLFNLYSIFNIQNLLHNRLFSTKGLILGIK